METDMVASGTWLHDRPEKGVFRLLIDAYRMRMENNYMFDGDVDVDSIYSGEGNGGVAFCRFLEKLCVAFGLGGSSVANPGGHWHSLQPCVEKADVIGHYGDPRFPMQLRMFAERVYGRGPGGE
ncbi:putative MYND domain protein [Apodospora peruviana]|uniref:MYND domain protein n=1 Tax=Apodospora peruviana TaxID=516989 RepID=A0AAE0HTY0_9PEZI|nr:putative MYND domain protein [Apodospora peruviana]